MKTLITVVIASFMTSVAVATPITFIPQPDSQHVVIGGNGVGCSLSAIMITGMTNLTDGTNPVPPAVTATDCYAVSEPNNDFHSTYNPNTGVLYEGMFNGESFKGYHVSPNLFLDNEKDQWVDENTPGWISLASVNGAEYDENEGLDPFAVTYSSVGGINLSEILAITFGIGNEGTGFWSLGFVPGQEDIVAQIEEILGRPTLFDHLSFVLKGPNGEPWFMYDFSFWDLIDDQNLVIDLNDPHNITGTWDPELFFSGKDVSHLEIVAHDPPPGDTEIPAPHSLLLFALGLIGLGLRQLKKS